MKVPLLDLQAQYGEISGAVDAAMAEVIRTQRFVLGPVVEQLESELARRVGVAHAIACASGTDALLLPLRALELAPGAEVLVPAFTFFATAGAVWNAGLRPVFVDVDPDTFNVTAETLEPALTDRTRALVVVHLFGQMAPMSEVMELAGRYGLRVIEDAAQAIDARQHLAGEWRAAGSVGTVGSFSFFPTKNLGSFGDGGLITTDDEVLAERLRKLRVHGGRQMYHHEMVGTNSRLDAIQAAVLLAKLPHLTRWTEARRSNAAAYHVAFDGLDGVRAPAVMEGNHHVYNQYTVRSSRRDALKQHLESLGIGSGVYYPLGLHLQECFASLGYRRGDLPNTERATAEVLSLPVYPELGPEQVRAVIDGVGTFHG